MEKLSIVIATLNCDSHIKGCIESIQIFNDKRIKIIVQDGGSTDETLDILESLNVNCVSECDGGIYDAFNKALKRVSTDWVMFLGADDRLLINPISIINDLMPPYKSIYYGNVINEDTGKVYDGKFTKFKIARKNICHQAILYHISAFEFNRFNLKYKYLSDYDFNLSLIDSGYGLKYLDKILAVYGGAGVSKMGDPVFEADRIMNIFHRLGLLILLLYFPVFILKKIRSILDFR
jgi:glycosyltransferase involved in cell wall biosynthesis